MASFFNTAAFLDSRFKTGVSTVAGNQPSAPDLDVGGLLSTIANIFAPASGSQTAQAMAGAAHQVTQSQAYDQYIKDLLKDPESTASPFLTPDNLQSATRSAYLQQSLKMEKERMLQRSLEAQTQKKQAQESMGIRRDQLDVSEGRAAEDVRQAGVTETERKRHNIAMEAIYGQRGAGGLLRDPANVSFAQEQDIGVSVFRRMFPEQPGAVNNIGVYDPMTDQLDLPQSLANLSPEQRQQYQNYLGQEISRVRSRELPTDSITIPDAPRQIATPELQAAVRINASLRGAGGGTASPDPSTPGVWIIEGNAKGVIKARLNEKGEPTFEEPLEQQGPPIPSDFLKAPGEPKKEYLFDFTKEDLQAGINSVVENIGEGINSFFPKEETSAQTKAIARIQDNVQGVITRSFFSPETNETIVVVEPPSGNKDRRVFKINSRGQIFNDKGERIKLGGR